MVRVLEAIVGSKNPFHRPRVGRNEASAKQGSGADYMSNCSNAAAVLLIPVSPRCAAGKWFTPAPILPCSQIRAGKEATEAQSRHVIFGAGRREIELRAFLGCAIVREFARLQLRAARDTFWRGPRDPAPQCVRASGRTLREIHANADCKIVADWGRWRLAPREHAASKAV